MQLREWGTDRTYPFPPPRAGDWLIGSAPDCWLQVQDREQYVSRMHALLRWDGHNWTIVDAASKNGVWIDGHRTESALLEPGTEIAIGRRRLIVESPRTIRLRSLIARLLGWGIEHEPAVDRGARAVREYAVARLPLWLSGSDDLVAIARRLHREVVGDDHPFVIGDLGHTRRSLEGVLRAARGGTLCVWVRFGADVRSLRELVADREPQARIIICARAVDHVMGIDIPALDAREAELERVIDEYALDAIAQLGAKPSSYTPADRESLVEHPPSTLAEIEVATLRLVAIREFGGVTHAAPHVGVTYSALSRWLARRFARPRRKRQPD